MPRNPPPPHPKGAPRTPGSGRKKGTPNKRTVALRELMAALSEDVHYQEKLREDFRKRRVHPSVELPMWEYAVGTPKQQIEMSAGMTMNERLAAERERLRYLDVAELEKLVAESDAMIARALATAQSNRQGAMTGVKPEHAAVETKGQASGDVDAHGYAVSAPRPDGARESEQDRVGE